MSINYFLEEIHGKGFEKVKVFVVIRHKLRCQKLRFWIVNRLLSPIIKFEVRDLITTPNQVIGCIKCATEI